MEEYLTNYENKTDGEILAIAHNSNLSNGIMFPLEAQWNGTELDETYVTQRIKWEPLYEITQIKGDGEAHPFLSPDDEFADYEKWDIGNLDVSAAKKDDMLAGEYGREALKRGLAIETRLGTNPYKFGLIGATDSHTSLATAEEDNFFGKHAGYEPKPRTDVAPVHEKPRQAPSWVGRWLRQDWPPSGLRKIPAKRFSMRCSARRSTARPGRA